LSTKTQQQQIEWRRDRVIELSSQGFTQSDIARVLQVDRSLISRDMTYIRQQARENLQKHIHETVPEEYQKCMVGINQVLQKAWLIVSRTADERVRLQALSLIDQCNSHKMDMVTNGAIITGALEYVNGKAEKLVSKQSQERREWKEEQEQEQEGVF
jgi:hypothetical protein